MDREAIAEAVLQAQIQQENSPVVVDHNPIFTYTVEFPDEVLFNFCVGFAIAFKDWRNKVSKFNRTKPTEPDGIQFHKLKPIKYF